MGKKRVLTIGVSAQESEDVKNKAASVKAAGAVKNLKKMVVK